MPRPIKVGRKERMTFAKINEVCEMPNLIQIQTDSYKWFIFYFDENSINLQFDCNKIEESLQDQYFKAIDDRSFSLKIQKWAKIGGLKTKYTLGDSLLHFMWLGFGSDKIEQEQRLLIVKELKK